MKTIRLFITGLIDICLWADAFIIYIAGVKPGSLTLLMFLVLVGVNLMVKEIARGVEE